MLNSPWTQRLLWTIVGIVLATGVFVYLGAQTASLPPEDATAASADPKQANTQENTPASPAGGCYLGVVLARDAVVVAAEAEGQLRAIDVRVGDEAQKDQILATLDTRAVQHQLEMERASLRTAQAEKRRSDLAVLQAEEEEKRRQRLEGVISSEEIAAAKFQRQQAEAQREASAAEISRVQASIEQLEEILERSHIKAPFSGTVAQRYLDAGALVSQGTPIVRLISSGGFLVRFALPPEKARQVTVGKAIRVDVDGLDIPLDGMIEHLAPEIDAASQMLFAEASLTAELGGTSVPSGAMAQVALIDDQGNVEICS